MKTLIQFFKEHTEWAWALGALVLVVLLNFLLWPFTATVSFDFIIKAAVSLFRIALAVALTFLEVTLVFRTIQFWAKDGGFLKAWNALDDEVLTDRQVSALKWRLLLTVLAVVGFFTANVIALNL